jgi:hypothetical protein
MHGLTGTSKSAAFDDQHPPSIARFSSAVGERQLMRTMRDEQRRSFLLDQGRSDVLTGINRCAAGVNRVDDLGDVDSLELDACDAEVAVAELALDDDQRDAFARQLDGVGVTELMRCEAPPQAGRDRGPAQVRARGRGRPAAAERRAPEPRARSALPLLPRRSGGSRFATSVACA